MRSKLYHSDGITTNALILQVERFFFMVWKLHILERLIFFSHKCTVVTSLMWHIEHGHFMDRKVFRFSIYINMHIHHVDNIYPLTFNTR